MSFLLAGAAAAALAGMTMLAYRLLRRRSSRRRSERSAAREEQRQQRAEERERRERERREAQEADERRQLDAKADKIQEAAKANPDSAERMAKRAGLGHNALRDVAWSRQAALDAAKRIPDDIIQACWLAATQKDIEFDLKAESRREQALWPTGDIQPEQMTDYAQITQVAPEQSVLLDDDQFYQQFAEKTLPVLQPYETLIRRKRLYILLDVSGSMKDQMRDGFARHVWARGVCANLLYKALAGQADYLLRFFDDQPHELLMADNPEAASRAIDNILDRGFSGGGTDIFAAFSQAVNDIRSRGGNVGCSEILVVTDGQDGSMDDANHVRRLLGSDINLHAALIGCDSPALRKVSKTYRTFF